MDVTTKRDPRRFRCEFCGASDHSSYSCDSPRGQSGTISEWYPPSADESPAPTTEGR